MRPGLFWADCTCMYSNCVGVFLNVLALIFLRLDNYSARGHNQWKQKLCFYAIERNK